jgi:hypothetical protein
VRGIWWRPDRPSSFDLEAGWAYGWATPTASFRISLHADSLTFSARTSGLGNAGKGSGIDAIF